MDKFAASPWVDEQNWRSRWNVIVPLIGGGQGEVFHARRKSDGKEGFLKVLKTKQSLERRGRFFREAVAYDSFLITGVPKLLESNAVYHHDMDYVPYIVTEFVSGPTLTEWKKGREVHFDEAVRITRQLLEILRDCHKNRCVHRDVKPDNIILCDGDHDQVILLDFGLSYHNEQETDFRTEHGQEVGNRFLRLPELSAGSFLKQDPRSDLAFAAGILYFLLTGFHPDLLLDESSKLPHQRSHAVASLQTVAGVRFARLIAFFDNCFAHDVSHRLSSAEIMLNRLNAMMEPENMLGTAEDKLAAVLSLMDTAIERRRIDTISRFKDGAGHLGPLMQRLCEEFNGTISVNYPTERVDANSSSSVFTWCRETSSVPFLMTNCEFIEVGDEVVLRLDGASIYRTPISTPDFGTEMKAAIRPLIFERIHKALFDPNALPYEAGAFVEIDPLTTLAEAFAAAKDTFRYVLAFVYDPAHASRGQLNYLLPNFLQNRRARDIMNSAFVTALVPLSQVASISNILDGQSMEASRWVVFDADQNALEQEVIYANGTEGERILSTLKLSTAA